MALDPLEIGVIALMGIAVFIWGPEKIPEIAKQIGTARKQLDVYTKQLNGISKELQTSMTTGNLDNLSNVLTGTGGGTVAADPSTGEVPGAAPVSQALGAPVTAAESAILPPVLVAPLPVAKSADQLLLEMARKIGISTQGKTRDEIQNEILTRASEPAETQAPGDNPAGAPTGPSISSPVQSVS